MVEFLEFRSDDSWEETIKFYYSQRAFYLNLADFIKEVNKNERFIYLENNVKSYNSSGFEADFKLFFQQTGLELNSELQTFQIHDEWYYKVFLIISSNYYIIKIVETSA